MVALSDNLTNPVLPSASVETSSVGVSSKQPERDGIPRVFIYSLSDPINSEVRYVGKTTNMKKRLRDHLRDRRNNYKTSWISSLLNDGKLPIIESLEEVEGADESVWQEAERFWITSLRFLGCRLVNLVDGGIGGINPSAETRLKHSLAMKGKKKSPEHIAKLIAFRNTPEYKARQSDLSRGRKHSKEMRQKMSAARIGIPRSKEHIESAAAGLRTAECRLKMSLANTGKKRTPEMLKRIRSLRSSKEFRAKMSKIMSLWWEERLTYKSK